MTEQPIAEKDAGRIEDLIEASSLGTPEARALRATVSDEHAARIVARAKEVERNTELGAEVLHAEAVIALARVMTDQRDAHYPFQHPKWGTACLFARRLLDAGCVTSPGGSDA